MSYFYVKNGGTADGASIKYAIKNTGSFADAMTNDWGGKGLGSVTAYYYSTLEAAEVYMLDGDVLFFSNVHNEITAGTWYYTIGHSIEMISVDDEEVSSYKYGAAIGSTNDDILFYAGNSKQIKFIGVIINFLKDWGASGNANNNNSSWTFQNCDIRCTGDGTVARVIYWNSIGVSVVLKDTAISFKRTDSYIAVGTSSSFYADNIHRESGYTLSANGLFHLWGDGSIIRIENSDISSMCSGYVFANTNLTQELFHAELYKCRIDPSKIQSTNSIVNYEIKANSCSSGSGYHYYENRQYHGMSSEDTSHYLNAKYDDTNGFSTLIESNARTDLYRQLKVKIASIPAQDLTSQKEYKINFSSNTTLTDTSFWIELSVPQSSTYYARGITYDSRNSDFLAIGTTHTTNSESWTGGGTSTYEDSVIIPAIAGVDNAMIDVYAYLIIPSIDVWVDPAVVLVE